ncbi:AbrB/MazE/SpoVT family DNA-binding domain-containing protein [Desulfurobacterium sp.]
MAKVKMDKFGRILIPKEIRKKLGIAGEMELEVEVKGEKILIKPTDFNLEMRVDEEISYLKNNAPKPFVSFEEGRGKWYSKEYSLRKAGLRE